jgi:tripartite-type tricarboxylate transporter receptor subunit TctC
MLAKWLKGTLLMLAGSLALTMPAKAEYPEKDVVILVGFAAGGGNDQQARLFATKLSKLWGKTVIVENRPGADGDIAARAVAEAKPDGYTLLYMSPNHTISAATKKLPFDAINDFAPVMMVGTTPNVLVVNPDAIPVKTLQEFIDYAKKNPKKVNFGGTGPLSPSTLAYLLFEKAVGIQSEIVSYKGSAPALTGLLNGEIQVMFGTPGRAKEFFSTKKIIPLAISSAERSEQLPDVKTVKELIGLDFSTAVWSGVLAPKGTPPEVIAKINAGMAEVLKDPDAVKLMLANETSIVASSPKEFGDFLKQDLETIKTVVKQ